MLKKGKKGKGKGKKGYVKYILLFNEFIVKIVAVNFKVWEIRLEIVEIFKQEYRQILFDYVNLLDE